MKHHKKHHTTHKCLLLGFVSGIGLLILAYILFHHQSLPAVVADNVLRPLIGEKATIQLESIYFGVSEKAKSIEYKFVKPSSNFYGTSQLGQILSDNAGNLELKPIHLEHPGYEMLPNEGVWQAMPSPQYPGQVVMARTFVRPDPDRSYANVAIVQIDMSKFNINIEAGIRHPGGTHGQPGPGFVPKAIQDSNKLAVVFNGGFQEKDGHYGMIVGPTTYLPLQNDLATLFMYKDGKIELKNYHGESLGSNIASIRQNGPMLIEHGQITPFVETGDDTWGRTTTNSLYTWRSGIGITKSGNLLYAVGGSLVPDTLARALQAAGAVDAMQLDINPNWVRFMLYTPLGNGEYSSTPLLNDLVDGGKSYLTGYSKDFFYLYKK